MRDNEELKEKMDRLYDEFDSKYLQLETLQEQYDEAVEKGKISETKTVEL